ncbi:MAG: hypothetical protein Kow0088_01070 [Anaerolineales bacterium]
MPIIDPTRLHHQIQECFAKQNHTREFVASIKELLDLYSDRTYRPGELATLPSALKSYHVPQPLLRTLIKELARLSQSQPLLAIENANLLWEQPYHECKVLAIALLENLPVEMESKIYTIAEQWVSTCNHSELTASIAHNALKSLRLKRPASLIEQARKWILDQRHSLRKFGLMVIEEISLTISFSDLPLLFRVISPYFNRCPSQIFPEVVAICNNLIEKSPKEMAYLMRKAILDNPTADAKKLIKTCLKSFPLEMQSELMSAIYQ